MSSDHVLRIADLDRHIQEALRSDPPIGDEHELVRFAPPTTRGALPPLPDYVEHRADIDVVGKAAAQAIVQQYDCAMKAMEAMGKELIDCVRHSQEMTEKALDAVKFVAETCDAYREESKAMFARIEHCSALTAEVRKICEDMRLKIAK